MVTANPKITEQINVIQILSGEVKIMLIPLHKVVPRGIYLGWGQNVNPIIHLLSVKSISWSYWTLISLQIVEKPDTLGLLEKVTD